MTSSEKAKKLGLTYAGGGSWKNKAGKIVAKTVDGELVSTDSSVSDTDSSSSTEEKKEVKVTAEKVGSARGSNPGGFYKGSDGKTRYVKFYRDADQAYTEYASTKIYDLLGLSSPTPSVFEEDGKVAYASEVIPNAKQYGEAKSKEVADKILDGFVADVLMSNWDAVGLVADNVLVDEGGNPSRIDNGGAFLFRAQGKLKPAELLSKIGEWETLADPNINREYAEVFRKAGYKNADALGGRAVKQIDKILDLHEKGGGWDKMFSKIAPKWSGKHKDTVVSVLEVRTKLLKKKRDELKEKNEGKRKKEWILSEASETALKAKALGLKYAGGGSWKDSSGQIVAKTVDSNIVSVDSGKDMGADVVLPPKKKRGRPPKKKPEDQETPDEKEDEPEDVKDEPEEEQEEETTMELTQVQASYKEMSNKVKALEKTLTDDFLNDITEEQSEIIEERLVDVVGTKLDVKELWPERMKETEEKEWRDKLESEHDQAKKDRTQARKQMEALEGKKNKATEALLNNIANRPEGEENTKEYARWYYKHSKLMEIGRDAFESYNLHVNADYQANNTVKQNRAKLKGTMQEDPDYENEEYEVVSGFINYVNEPKDMIELYRAGKKNDPNSSHEANAENVMDNVDLKFSIAKNYMKTAGFTDQEIEFTKKVTHAKVQAILTKIKFDEVVETKFRSKKIIADARGQNAVVRKINKMFPHAKPLLFKKGDGSENAQLAKTLMDMSGYISSSPYYIHDAEYLAATRKQHSTWRGKLEPLESRKFAGIQAGWQATGQFSKSEEWKKKSYKTINKIANDPNNPAVLDNVTGPLYRGMRLREEDIDKFMAPIVEGAVIEMIPQGYSFNPTIAGGYSSFENSGGNSSGNGLPVILKLNPNKSNKLIGISLSSLKIGQMISIVPDEKLPEEVKTRKDEHAKHAEEHAKLEKRKREIEKRQGKIQGEKDELISKNSGVFHEWPKGEYSKYKDLDDEYVRINDEISVSTDKISNLVSEMNATYEVYKAFLKGGYSHYTGTSYPQRPEYTEMFGANDNQLHQIENNFNEEREVIRPATKSRVKSISYLLEEKKEFGALGSSVGAYRAALVIELEEASDLLMEAVVKKITKETLSVWNKYAGPHGGWDKKRKPTKDTKKKK